MFKRLILPAIAMALLASLPAAADGIPDVRELAAKFPKAKPVVDAALKGDAKAMKKVGILYEVALRNHRAAARWYKAAALKRNARAQLLLANSYQHGRGVPQSVTLAFAWYITASDECGRDKLSDEATNGDFPSKGQWAEANEVSYLIRLALTQFAKTADCSEFYDTGTMKRE